MAECIEREILLDRANLVLATLKNMEKTGFFRRIGKISGARISTIASLVGIMKEPPAADVAPVVHGRWILQENDIGFKMYECNNCKEDEYWKTRCCFGDEPFCPNCGARMDGGEEA